MRVDVGAILKEGRASWSGFDEGGKSGWGWDTEFVGSIWERARRVPKVGDRVEIPLLRVSPIPHPVKTLPRVVRDRPRRCPNVLNPVQPISGIVEIYREDFIGGCRSGVGGFDQARPTIGPDFAREELAIVRVHRESLGEEGSGELGEGALKRRAEVYLHYVLSMFSSLLFNGVIIYYYHFKQFFSTCKLEYKERLFLQLNLHCLLLILLCLKLYCQINFHLELQHL